MRLRESERVHERGASVRDYVSECVASERVSERGVHRAPLCLSKPSTEFECPPPGEKLRPCTVTTAPAPAMTTDGTAAPLFTPSPCTPKRCVVSVPKRCVVSYGEAAPAHVASRIASGAHSLLKPWAYTSTLLSST
jgi:hypothetical protein